MSNPIALKSRARATLSAMTPLFQLLACLAVGWLLMQKFALDIHIHEPDMAISLQLTVSDHNSAATYSFNLPPLRTDAGDEPQTEST